MVEFGNVQSLERGANRDMTEWEGFLETIRNRIVSFYGENLVAATIFGSAARGDFQKESDLDLLIVIRESRDSIGKRIDDFMKMEREIRKSPEFALAKSHGFPHHIEPVILTLEEFRQHPPLLLDLTTDARIFIDQEDIFSSEIDSLKKRLKAIGAKKVFLRDGRWYWMLKPDIRWGEKVVL